MCLGGPFLDAYHDLHRPLCQHVVAGLLQVPYIDLTIFLAPFALENRVLSLHLFLKITVQIDELLRPGDLMYEGVVFGDDGGDCFVIAVRIGRA